jgi:phage gp16-like protein
MRKNRLAAIHMGKKALGLDDDTYRDMLEHVTGKRSAKDMSDDHLVKVLQHMETLGFNQRKDFGKSLKSNFLKSSL